MSKKLLILFIFMILPIIDGCLSRVFDDSEVEGTVYEPCPEEWKQKVFDDVPYCYLAVIGAYLPQSNAQKDCERHNSSLVSIHSEDEHNFVYLLTSSNLRNETVDPFQQQTWIGLVYEFDSDHLPKFSWLDGTEINFPENYPFNIGGPNKYPWALNEPNHLGEEYCVVLITNPAKALESIIATWGDVGCINPMENYVCKKRLHQ